MKLPAFYFFPLLVLAFSCNIQDKNSQVEKELNVRNSIDPNKIIAELNIREKYEALDSINEKINSLSERIDTLELTYYFRVCNCPRWIDSGIHDEANEFDLDNHGYYIEPAINITSASERLRLNWRIEANGTKVRFIGRKYTGKGLAKNEKFTAPDLPLGKVFRYYSYELIRPYKIWAPPVYSIDKETGNTPEEPFILTIK